MAAALGPLSLGEILDRTVQLYRRNFRLFAGIAVTPSAIVTAGYAVQIVLGQPAGTGRHSPLHFAFFSFVELLLTLVVGAYSHAAFTSAAVDIHLGRPVTFHAAAFRILPRYWRFLRLSALQWLIVLGIPCGVAIVAAIPVVILGTIFAGSAPATAAGVTVALTFAAFMGPAIWLLSRVALAVAVCWVEDKTAWASIKRASALSKAARGRVAMAYVFFYAIFGITIALRLSILAAVGAYPIHAAHHLAGAQLLLDRIFEILYSFATETLLTPLAPTALAILYIDQRVRKEGFDIDWMMYQAGLHVPQTPPVRPAVPTAPAPSSMPLPDPATVKEP